MDTNLLTHFLSNTLSIEWEMKRLTASIAVCGRFLGLDKKTIRKSIAGAVRPAASSFLNTIF